MSRIRSVHPGLWTDDAFVSLSALARLLAIGLWNECDDQGVFEWKPLTLKMRIFPADNLDIATLLAELTSANIIMPYEVGGRKLGAVRNFRRYQRPKKPTSTYPITDEIRKYVALTPPSSVPPDDDEGGGSELPLTNGHMVSEPPPLKRRSGSPPVPHQFPTSGEIGPQMEDGGDKMERKLPASFPIAARERDWPDPLPTDRLNVEGYEIFQRRFECTPNRTAMFVEDWVKAASWMPDPERRVMGVLRQSERENPKNREDFGAFLARSLKRPAPAEPPIPIRQPSRSDPPSAWDTLADGFTLDQNGKRIPCVNGYIIHVVAHAVLQAARINDANWRGDWRPLVAWLQAGIVSDDIISAVRNVAARPGYKPPASLAYFDQPVRQARQAA